MKIKNLYFSFFNKNESSINIDDPEIIRDFISNPDFPWLISYPRTGSHWLRMLMELYFNKPSLVRVFYYKDAKDFTCYHRHDDNLDIQNIKNVIYVYRNPVDTIFSLTKYYRHSFEDDSKIVEKTRQYSDHLSKWLLKEGFTKKKVIISYEGLKSDLNGEFIKLTEFFGAPFSAEKLKIASTQVSKSELKRKTTDNKQIVNTRSDYENQRHFFKLAKSEIIINTLVDQNPELSTVFNDI